MIDMMDDVTYTEAQLLRRGELLIREQVSADSEAVLNRKATGAAIGAYTLTAEEQDEITAYQTHVETVRSIIATARLDNATKLAAIAYEQAVLRLSQVIKSVGRPEQAYQAATYDELGNLLTAEVPYLQAIPAEPLQVEVPTYDAAGNITGTTLVDNPVVLQDLAERAAAQAIIDGTTQPVLDVVAQRGRI